MEGSKQVGSSSSFTSELFGSNELHPSSSSGIFDSIFSPSPKVFGRESLNSALNGKNVTEGLNSKIDYISKGSDGENQKKTAYKDMSSIYQEQRVQPCHLSSSIYYGGQDIYSHPQSTRDSGLNTLSAKSRSQCIDDHWVENRLFRFQAHTRKMGARMIQEVPQEETGGKDLSIIKKSILAKGYAPQG